MSGTLVLGFSIIAGILFGYFTGRVGQWRVSLTLCLLCAAAGVSIYAWGATQPDEWGLWSVFFLGLIAGPFLVSAAFAWLIAILVRRVSSDPEDE